MNSRVAFALLGSSLGVFALLLGCLERRDNDTTPASEDECTTCHGGTLESPWTAAPPLNLAGESERSARGNGAHAIHLAPEDGFRALACTECHQVPTTLYEPGHVDTPYPAEVTIKGPGTAFEATPEFDAESGTCKNTFCHGGSFVGGRPSGGTLTEPAWTQTDGEPAVCGSCHGLPPALPHPEVTTCSDCHKNILADGSFVRPDLHVDGKVTFYLPAD